MEKIPFRCYINFSGNASLLNTCIESLLPQLKEFSSIENPICILNNTNTKLKDWLIIQEGWTELHPPVPLIWATAHNWILSLAKKNNEPFAMSTHTDVILQPGAMEELFNRYETVNKETNGKWHIVCAVECLSIQNWKFFYNENIFYDAFLFPMYYSDNHIARLAFLRGYKEHMYYTSLVIHNKSHTIRDNSLMGQRNGLGFGYASQAYSAIWGGPPGAETKNDPYNFCYPLEERYYNYIDEENL